MLSFTNEPADEFDRLRDTLSWMSGQSLDNSGLIQALEYPRSSRDYEISTDKLLRAADTLAINHVELLVAQHRIDMKSVKAYAEQVLAIRTRRWPRRILRLHPDAPPL